MSPKFGRLGRFIGGAMRSIRISPSILTADWLHLGEEIKRAEAAGVELIHLDIMDGHFVPNMTFGPVMVESVRRATELPLDVHLMISDPDSLIPAFAEAGADILTVHAEAATHLHATLTDIRNLDVMPAVSLNPLSPLSLVEEAVPYVGQVLLMTVNPGFGGQTFIPSALDRIRRLRAIIDAKNPECALEVDGGINERTIGKVVEAGADTIVAGSAIFNRERSVADNVAALRRAIERATSD